MTAPARHLVMTVDTEDWFTSSIDLFPEAVAAGHHGRKPDPSVVPNTLRCLELFARTNSRATFFILTTVAEHFPDLVREIELRGHEIGVHGYRHRLVYQLTPEQFREDLEHSLDLLRPLCSRPILGFRAPYWSITRRSLWALDILRHAGLRYDASIFPIHRRLYGIPDAPTRPHEIRPGFWEFPPATTRVLRLNIPIAGGGYLRILPWILLKRLIRRARRLDDLVFYLHPYELDSADTQTGCHLTRLASRLSLWQQKLGRRRNAEKIERLLDLNRFESIAGAFAHHLGLAQA